MGDMSDYDRDHLFDRSFQEDLDETDYPTMPFEYQNVEHTLFPEFEDPESVDLDQDQLLALTPNAPQVMLSYISRCCCCQWFGADYTKGEHMKSLNDGRPMDDMSHLPPSPNKSVVEASRTGVSEERWEELRLDISRLYIKEEMTQEQVLGILRRDFNCPVS